VKKKIEKSIIQPKSKTKCTVLPASCVMMWGAPHHDTWRSSYCPDSSLTRHPLYIHTLNSLSLSLSLSLYSIFSLYLSSSSREEVVENVEEKKEEEGEGVL
jgi:hypothetical protein